MCSWTHNTNTNPDVRKYFWSLHQEGEIFFQMTWSHESCDPVIHWFWKTWGTMRGSNDSYRLVALVELWAWVTVTIGSQDVSASAAADWPFTFKAEPTCCVRQRNIPVCAGLFYRTIPVFWENGIKYIGLNFWYLHFKRTRFVHFTSQISKHFSNYGPLASVHQVLSFSPWALALKVEKQQELISTQTEIGLYIKLYITHTVSVCSPGTQCVCSCTGYRGRVSDWHSQDHPDPWDERPLPLFLPLLPLSPASVLFFNYLRCLPTSSNVFPIWAHLFTSESVSSRKKPRNRELSILYGLHFSDLPAVNVQSRLSPLAGIFKYAQCLMFVTPRTDVCVYIQ